MIRTDYEKNLCSRSELEMVKIKGHYIQNGGVQHRRGLLTVYYDLSTGGCDNRRCDIYVIP